MAGVAFIDVVVQHLSLVASTIRWTVRTPLSLLLQSYTFTPTFTPSASISC